MANQMTPKSRLPRWWVRDGRNQTREKVRVICTFPRAQRTRCFHSAVTVSGSSASTTAAGSNTTRRPFSCVRKVVYVSSASVEVSTCPPTASRFSRECSWAPPARHAMAPMTFCARRAAACAVTYS
jgi:hypothetical protein